MLNRLSVLTGLLASALLVAPAVAATDPVGDFLATYTGPQNANLDIVSASATFDGANFNLTATMNGVIGSSPDTLFVWAINRGAGTPRLNFLSTPALDPSVRWDAGAVLFTGGTLRVVAFPAVGAPTITPIIGGAVVNGNSISTSVPLGLLPSRGFDPTAYTFQLWSRLRVNPAADGFNSEIADFGPRVFASVPEPATWAMMVGGFGMIGAASRRSRTRASCA
jgi:hypothetical protein